MAYKFVFLPPPIRRLKLYAKAMLEAVEDLEVIHCENREEALTALPDAKACFGTLDPELLEAGPSLQWLMAPMAGPPKGYYFDELIRSEITVTNFRGVFNDHISTHIMAFVLAFSRGMHRYFRDQFEGRWCRSGESSPPTYLPESTALIIGVGGIGVETACQCKNWGMRVIGVDPRAPSAPPGVDELYRPEKLDLQLPKADFVILTAPQTPATEGLFSSAFFRRMKKSAFFINIGRGSNVVLADLNRALHEGQIAGAGLDVFEVEPLPKDHPLWTAPNFLMTPHVAGLGLHLDDRRGALIAENAQRFAEGRKLLNIVDKTNWF